MFLEMIPAQRAYRMRLATRQRIEGGETLESHARDDRLQTRDVEWIAAIVDGGGTPPEHAGTKCACMAGERNNLRSPAYASILRLRSVKGPLRQASPALDPRYGASLRSRQAPQERASAVGARAPAFRDAARRRRGHPAGRAAHPALQVGQDPQPRELADRHRQEEVHHVLAQAPGQPLRRRGHRHPRPHLGTAGAGPGEHRADAATSTASSPVSRCAAVRSSSCATVSATAPTEVAEQMGYRASSIRKVTNRCLAALTRQLLAVGFQREPQDG